MRSLFTGQNRSPSSIRKGKISISVSLYSNKELINKNIKCFEYKGLIVLFLLLFMWTIHRLWVDLISVFLHLFAILNQTFSVLYLKP